MDAVTGSPAVRSAGPGSVVGAVRVSRCVRERLEAGARAVVLAVHRRACHLALEDGPLLILSTPEIPLAPNALAVATMPALRAGTGLDFQTIRPGRPGIVWKSRPDPVVVLDGAATWEPRPRVRRLDGRVLAERLRATRATVVAEGAGASLLPLLWASEGSAPPPGLVRSASLPARLLANAAIRNDAESVARAARGLAGLGPGLTPSGDDLLTGFAASWALVGESLDIDTSARQRVTDALVTGAHDGASPLGLAWLGHAGRGEILEPMTELVAALLGPEPGGLDAAARGALGVGASSGTDWMVGFILGASATLDATRRRPW